MTTGLGLEGGGIEMDYGHGQWGGNSILVIRFSMGIVLGVVPTTAPRPILFV